jgi:hypothetical protein
MLLHYNSESCTQLLFVARFQHNYRAHWSEVAADQSIETLVMMPDFGVDEEKHRNTA